MKNKYIYFLILVLIFIVIAIFCFWRWGVIITQPEIKTVIKSETHYSYFSQKDFYEQAYTTAKPLASHLNDVKGVLVNHHLLAGNFIAESFNNISTTAPITVLLISPNHFSAGKGSIIVSNSKWKTPYGNLLPDSEFINSLVKEGLVSLEEDPYDQEHGISGIVAFIKKSLPNAKVAPIIINDRLSISEAMSIASNIESRLPKNAMVVGSFDFSHYLTLPAADFHDLESLSAVENFNFEAIPRLDIDSRSGLAIFLKILQIKGAGKFNLLEHNNSAVLAKDESALETTSYFTGYFIKGKPKTDIANTLLSLGDIECSQKVKESLIRTNQNFSVEYLERLFTGQAVTAARVLSGDEWCKGVLGKFGFNNLIEKNPDVNLGNLKIKYIHFSGTENEAKEARQAADAGAEVVIGDSKNIRLEIYKGKLIIYGQGDLLTDKTLENGSISLGTGFCVHDSQLELYLLPIKIKDGKAKLLVSGDDVIVLKELAERSVTSLEIKSQIKKGKLILNK